MTANGQKRNSEWKPHEYDQLIKLLLVGDSGVGKSCLLLRFCDNQFTPSFITTIGIDFKIRTVDIDGKRIKLQVWDTAGQERFRTITTTYYRNAMGVLVVFDVTDRNSFNHVESWLRNVEEYANDQISIMLVGNKVDLVDSRVVSTDEGRNLAKKLNIPYFEASAKSKEGVEDAFFTVARQIKHRMDKAEAESRPRTESFRLSYTGHERYQQKMKKGGCC